MEIVRDIMRLETHPAYQLRGKTGTGLLENLSVGWFVGYEERDGNVFFFALNITSTNTQVNGATAKQILLDILHAQGP